MGFPDLDTTSKRKVLQGNDLLAVTLRLIEACEELSIPWALENPFTSRIWLTPPLQHHMHHGASFLRRDFCAFGTAWRKSTGILSKRLPQLTGLAISCDAKNGRCQFSGKQHIILQGKDATGCWLTRRAQPYPFKLCHQIASLLARTM